MTDNNIPVIDTMYKDDSPINTVNRIKNIFNDYGIKTIERWNDSGVPYCYSLRVSVFGTVFGVNGKGVTKEFALASGYGELMERLQLGRVFKGDQQKDGTLYSFSINDDYLSPDELLLKNKKIYSIYSQEAERITGDKITPDEIINQYIDNSGKVPVTSFYCINTEQNEYLPTALMNSVYTTNGCAAGNTMEEAVVQAISEIVERKISTYVIENGILVPDIPDDVLRKYEISYKIVTFLRDNGFKVIIKDCSLGEKFPVVCVCIIDEKTGKYHTHFGAYPKFEIALERTLTESFQGRRLDVVAHVTDFIYNKDKKFDLGDTVVQFVKGSIERRPAFFNSAEFKELKTGFEGTTNKELLKECIEYFKGQGYDIYVRNHSCLGFPTYRVIIPGYSEVFVHRVNFKFNDVGHNKSVQAVLRNPTAVSIKDIMSYIMHLKHVSKTNLSPASFSKQTNLPLLLNANEQQYYMDATMASIFYTLGQYKETVRHIDRMINNDAYDNNEQLICIKRYLSLTREKFDNDEVQAILKYFHNKETVDNLLNAISNGQNPMKDFTLNCDVKCQHSCKLINYCLKKQTDNLSQLINDKMSEINQSEFKIQFDKLFN